MALHKSGFVNIIGKPNVGKSTLMNALVGERMSIITNKPQTTRHRIIGIVSGDDFQIVFSDTPGVIDSPNYRMQETMNKYAFSAFEDADVMMLVVEWGEIFPAEHPLFQRLNGLGVPVFLVINKIDLAQEGEIQPFIDQWKALFGFREIILLSALENINIDLLKEKVLTYLPEGPEYYPKDQLTDRPERFFVSEIIREKILMLYQQEVPYSCEVVTTQFKEETTTKGQPIVNISAEIYVARKTQKSILIGKGGAAIKKLGMEARQSIEAFLETKVFLELFVKIKENWRDDERTLKQFGY
ncbi:MAG TPA: GTPase Era [Saprospiraceae bacterium]|nr:GTPase Era [Saprospiraceae bacterium]HMQ84469.1 GTPase Era [Saprospiraceae bacterium]